MDTESGSTDGEINEQPTLLSRAINTSAAFIQPLISKRAQKAYLGTLLLFLSAICMVVVSTIAYGIFYYKIIPQVGLERVVHLQFGDGHPWGTTSLGSGLISLQPYDVSVELELPRTPSNLGTGNFMVDLTLIPGPSSPILDSANASTDPFLRSRRPAILTYASPLIDTASKLSFMPFYVLGWQRESEKLQVPMMERIQFARGRRNIPDRLRLEIHSQQQMQIYKAKVAFRARFTGMRWLMYNWRITSFFVFTFMFWSTSMISASIVWIVLATFANSGTDGKVTVKKEDRDETRIKQEPLEESTSPLESSLDTSNDQPERRVKKEKEYQVESQADDESEGSPDKQTSGAGTGLESSGAQGVQRRRRHTSGDDDSH
ncbi:adipose-regulatory protein [Aspergillus steynii IBT 23096]|uniref:Adipose-regulatory protein n=1 Tax=Aspergillus steynii IBT 23096 TaxID=1392250 RepID=A0A2I2GJE1_9EURO|nr:adipose-regulatory protein [Aspergillus steynii IBT 23096]PLB53003.1 adipose-regulatory protein [Aspergillus steynii IBT 23096]